MDADRRTGGGVQHPHLSVTTFTAPGDPAVLTFTLTVTDSLGPPDPTPDEVVITVNNQPPGAGAGPDQTVSRLALVTLDGSGSSDPDGDLPLTYLMGADRRPGGDAQRPDCASGLPSPRRPTRRCCVME